MVATSSYRQLAMAHQVRGFATRHRVIWLEAISALRYRLLPIALSWAVLGISLLLARVWIMRVYLSTCVYLQIDHPLVIDPALLTRVLDLKIVALACVAAACTIREGSGVFCSGNAQLAANIAKAGSCSSASCGHNYTVSGTLTPTCSTPFGVWDFGSGACTGNQTYCGNRCF